MTPTRSELAAMIAYELKLWECPNPEDESKAAADVVLPLLEAKDARIAELVADQSALDMLDERDARIAELEADLHAARNEVEYLRTVVPDRDRLTAALHEAAEARAENERLRGYAENDRAMVNVQTHRILALANERDEARRIADQLAEAPMWGTWYQPGVTNAARKAWEGRSWREAAPRSRT